MRTKFAWGASAVVVSALVVGTAFAAEPVKSGLQPGDRTTPFDVQDITGPNKGKSLCYR
jgi:hypothetical protein